MTQLFIKNGNAHEKNVHLLEEISQLKNEKIQWAEEKSQMQLKIQELELQLKSCNSKSAQKSEPTKREPNIQGPPSPELQIEKPEIKKEFLGERKLATATRKALCKVCGATFNRNASVRRHFKNKHAESCLSAYASPEEIQTFKTLEKKEPDQWLQLRDLTWDQWIKDDGSGFGRPKKTTFEVATPKNAPEKGPKKQRNQ